MSESNNLRKKHSTVGEALQYCSEALTASDVYFGHGTDNAWDEAVQLVLSVADLPVDSGDGVLPHLLNTAAQARMEALLSQRIEQHTPLPYLLGRAWFAGLEFLSDPRAIIPRSPIAELILNQFQPWYSGPQPKRLLDLCCGGGCIGLAVAHYYPDVQVDLLDIDTAALDLVRENAEFLGVQDRVNIVQSDIFSELGNVRYDLILSNPPYVDSEDMAGLPEEFRHEPELALASGADGLDLTRRILRHARDYLEENGLLIVEVGNSWTALEQAYPRLPFTWLEFEQGGHGVFALTAKELQDYGASVA